MDKIIQAINTMIDNPKLISEITSASESSNEVFFKYKDKYFWGANYYEGEYYVYFYPNVKNISKLIQAAEFADWDSVKYKTFSTKEFKSIEARQSFKALFDMITEKADGFDSILDDIIDG